MEKSHEIIANIKIQFSENCTELQNKILQDYWEFKDLDFDNNPKKCKEKYKLSQSDLSKIIRDFSSLLFYRKCDKCNSFEKHEVKSISSFKTIVNKTKHICFHCIIEEYDENEKIEKEKIKIARAKLTDAIENKNWKNLSKFELNVFVKCLDLNNSDLKSYFGDILGQKNFIKLIKALESIEKQNLIVLQRNKYNNYITDHQYLSTLKEYKDEIIDEYNNYQSIAESNYDTNELKLKLTINESFNHPDSPQYAGTIIFKERIVIEPNTEYVFAQWTRSDNNLFFSLVPLKSLEKLPKQERISEQPKLIKEIIEDFFKNINKK